MRSFRTALMMACTAAAALCLIFSAGAQQPTGRTNQTPYPIVPVIVEYEYAPVYFSQDIDDNPHYSSIIAIVSKSTPPVYKIILAEKETKRRVYYSNSEAKVKALAREGKEAHLATIDYKVIQTVGQRPTHGFGFRDKRGQPILWRFIPASTPSKLGAGLTPLSKVPGLRLEYRDLGTAAGAGTAIQIGDKVSEAAPWPEISSPPYFIAYHGSYTEGRHIGALPLRNESWRVVRAPKELSEGAQWTLVNENGMERKMQIAARRGDDLTINEIGDETGDSTAYVLNVRVSPQGFALRSILLKSVGRVMHITFNPELSLAPEASSPISGEVTFQIDQGDNKKLVQGVVTTERQGNILRLRWQPKSPDWAKSRRLDSAIKLDDGGYSIEVSQP
jgi:hypothetical protein